jgi:hypothetical protein
MGQWFQRLRANAKYGAVNDATIQGYLRAASQLEDVWQQIDDKVDALLLEGLPPWEAYATMGYALAFVRACRMNVVFAQQLLKAEAATSNTGTGYLPRITYDQALALCEHIEPTIEEAIKAAANPRYTLPQSALPLRLGPHVGDGYQSFPLSHLQGTIGAAQEMRDWTAGLLAKYELALQATKEPVPPQVATHLERMKSELGLGDFHLRTGVDMVGQISQGQVTEMLQRKAEGLLWEAMEGFYSTSQLIAMPGAHLRPAAPRTPAETAQPRPPQAPALRQPEEKVPTQPTPDTLSMLNQVIAEPKPVQRAPAQPAAETIDLLNQVGAGSPPERVVPAPKTPDVAGLFGKDAPAQRASRPATTDAPPDMAGLLDQGPAQGASSKSAARPSSDPGRKIHQRKAESEDTTLGLLSEIVGDQEQSNE